MQVSRREPMDVSKGIGLPFQVVKGRCTLTKELLANCVTVISQVDAKFISCVGRLKWLTQTEVSTSTPLTNASASRNSSTVKHFYLFFLTRY